MKRQAEKYEAEIDLLKGRIRLLEKDVAMNSNSRHETSYNNSLTRVLSNTDLRRESRMEKLVNEEKE